MLSDIPMYVKVIASSITIISAVIGLYKYAFKRGAESQINNRKKEVLQNRYELIYVPMLSLLLDKHVTSAIAVLYPTFKKRLKRSYGLFKKKKFNKGYIALWDKYGKKPSAEIEWGGEFPIKELSDILESNLEWTDEKLLYLIQRIKRSYIENSHMDYYVDWSHPHNNSLTESEFELYNHIHDMYKRLNKLNTK